MISFGRSMLLGAVLAIGSVTGATAADLGGSRGGSLKDYGYQPNIVASNPSFYLRVDGGFAQHDKPFLIENGTVELTDPNHGSAFTVGGGIGYYYSKNIRFDITYDRRFQSDISGYRFDVAQQNPAGNPTGDCKPAAGNQTSCYGTRRFGLTSDVVLANAYFDFDCRCHVTPYVGVGLGFAHHQTNPGTVTNVNGVVGDIASASNITVAAALMAGFSLQLRDRLAFDAGYRFLYLGDAATGDVKDRVAAQVVAPDPTVEAIHAHEFRVGLRYDFR